MAGGDILYWFRVTTTPEGGAPREVRDAWIGVPLPVRHALPVEAPASFIGRDVADRSIVRHVADGVAVDRDDAVAALRLFGRDEAAAWWSEQFVRHPLTAALGFRRHEGELLPIRVAMMLHPELADFTR